MTLPTGEDITAMIDVLGDVIEESDEAALADCVELMDRLAELSEKAKLASDMVKGQALRLLEQPKVINGRRYKRTAVYSKRFDHRAIGRMVVDHARVDLDTGEARGDTETIRKAVDAMLAIYTSDSTKAKTTELRRILGVGNAEEENLVRQVRSGDTVAWYPVDG